MIFQYFQSNSESVMNGICGLLALASVKIYTCLDFSCPCLPHYNMAYGLGIMFVPPIALFLCGLILNRQSLVMLEEWRRPQGHRRKDLAVIRWGLHQEQSPPFHLFSILSSLFIFHPPGKSTTSKLISQCFAPRVWGLRHSQCMCSVHVWVFHQGLNVQEDEMLVCARRVPLPSWSLFINSIVISFLSAQLLQTCH